MKLFITIAVFASLILSCKSIYHSIPKYPDRVMIYKLSRYASYPVAIPCNRIAKTNGVTQLLVTSKKEIKYTYLMFNDSANFKLDTSFHHVDSRMLLVFIYPNGRTDSICLNRTGLIVERCNKFYFSNEKIQNYMLSKY